MPGRLEQLPTMEIEGHAPSVQNGAAHPMRTMTRRAAGLEGEPWDAEARATVAAYFDGLAADWHTRTSPERDRVVVDALERGLADGIPPGTCLEVGSGIGAYTPLLTARWPTVLAVEVSMEMLRAAPPDQGHRVLADGAALPVPDGSAGAVVLVNCFLFPAEVDRVLGPGGVVVWVNSSGTQTPIHLMPEEVLEALPGRWEGRTARAGIGLWTVLQRTGS